MKKIGILEKKKEERKRTEKTLYNIFIINRLSKKKLCKLIV
ncbi:MAG: hypothetical protein QXW69_07635 [Nitrososphaerota archaeon]